MIFIFIFVCVIFNVVNSEPPSTFKNPVVVIQSLTMKKILESKGLYNSYPSNIIDNKETICKALNDALVLDVTGLGAHSSGWTKCGLNIQAQSSTEQHTVKKIIQSENVSVDLLPCEYKIKNGVGWIYLAGSSEFNGYILLIFPPDYDFNSDPGVLGFLAEMYQFEIIMNPEEELGNAFKNFSSPESHFNEVYQKTFDSEVEAHIQCASVSKMIWEKIRPTGAVETNLEIQFGKKDISSFIKKVSSKSVFTIFKKSKDYVVSVLTCKFYLCSYNIFSNPKNSNHLFVIYNCRGFPESKIAYFKKNE